MLNVPRLLIISLLSPFRCKDGTIEVKTSRRFQNTTLQVQNMAKTFSACFELSEITLSSISPVRTKSAKCTRAGVTTKHRRSKSSNPPRKKKKLKKTNENNEINKHFNYKMNIAFQ